MTLDPESDSRKYREFSGMSLLLSSKKLMGGVSVIGWAFPYLTNPTSVSYGPKQNDSISKYFLTNKLEVIIGYTDKQHSF